MQSFWIAVRDFLVLLALSWIGVTAVQTPEPAREMNKMKHPAVSVSACPDDGICNSARPSFNTGDC